MSDIRNEYKVKIYSQNNPSRRVEFDVTPDLSESVSVDYKAIQPVHIPGTIYVYGTTASRSFDVSAKLVSRTEEEASRNLIYLQNLRSWTKPVFGKKPSSNGTDPSNEDFRKYAATGPEFTFSADNEKLGAPPELLYLTAYSKESARYLQHLNKIPVVLSQLNIPYPADVDYIPTSARGVGGKVPMPTVITISITLLEAHSALEFEKFSLSDYRKGKLNNF